MEFSCLVEVGNVVMCGTRDITTEHGNTWFLNMAVQSLILPSVASFFKMCFVAVHKF